MKFTSPIVSGGSGSLAGLTVSRNRGGLYMRARAVPVNPATPFQTAVRIIFGNLAVAWQTLSQVQRDAWETYAINVPITGPLGAELVLTGQQMYIRCNSARLQAGLTRVDVGPVIFSLATLTAVTVDTAGGTGQQSVTFDNTEDWATNVDGALLIYGSRPVAPTIRSFKGPYRFANAILGAVIPPTSPDITGTSPFTVTTGQGVFNRAIAVNADGRISQEQFLGPNLVT